MKTTKNKKVYRVQIGLAEDGHDIPNHDSRTVVADDVQSALKKVRLRKNCYYSGCECTVYNVDRV